MPSKRFRNTWCIGTTLSRAYSSFRFPPTSRPLTIHSTAIRLAAEYGLAPRFQANFQTIFAEEQEDPYFSNLLRRMNVMDAEGNAEMDEDQLDAASELLFLVPW